MRNLPLWAPRLSTSAKVRRFFDRTFRKSSSFFLVLFFCWFVLFCSVVFGVCCLLFVFVFVFFLNKTKNQRDLMSSCLYVCVNYVDGYLQRAQLQQRALSRTAATKGRSAIGSTSCAGPKLSEWTRVSGLCSLMEGLT